MDDPPLSESTPLLCPNQNRSNSKASSPDYMNQNGYVSFQSHDTPGIILHSNNQRWRSNTFRSEESSQALASLAVDKKMSDPRRTLCLFVTFDFLLTTLLWLIEIGTSSNGDFFAILKEQIVEMTSLHTSLFDVVILSFGRFSFLVVTYAICRIRHYWPVAVSTAISDAFLIVKIFAVFPGFGKPSPSSVVQLNVPMTIVLILTDFILTWIEVWFVDFKVLPAEAKLAQRTAQAFLQQSYQSAPSVDDPMSRRLTFATRSEIEAGRFYSPRATPAPSESGLTTVTSRSMYYSVYAGHGPMQLPHAQQELVEAGIGGLTKLWEMYEDAERWTVEKNLNNGDVVYSTETPEYGKSFKIVTTVKDRTPDVILREIILKPENMPIWNKSVSDVKILQRIGEQTCVTLEVSAPAAMGLISSREFITVRRFEKRGNTYVSAGISTDQCEDIVPVSNYVRGVNGPTGFVVYPSDDDPSSSVFIWILNTDLKGNLSRTLVNKNLTRTMIEFVTSMKRQLNVD